jgi:hypothetical protein
MADTRNQINGFCGGKLPAKPSFKVFIACDNHLALLQARKVQHQVEALCAGEMEVWQVVWNFSLLRHSELREHATREAAAAEMVVLSLCGTSELPGHVKRWMEGLPSRRRRGEAALVALTGPGRGQSNYVQLDFLRQIAATRKLDFICNQSTRLLEVERSVDSPENTRSLRFSYDWLVWPVYPEKLHTRN